MAKMNMIAALNSALEHQLEKDENPKSTRIQPLFDLDLILNQTRINLNPKSIPGDAKSSPYRPLIDPQATPIRP